MVTLIKDVLRTSSDLGLRLRNVCKSSNRKKATRAFMEFTNSTLMDVLQVTLTRLKLVELKGGVQLTNLSFVLVEIV